jgi:hypothetical protein
MGRLRPEAHHGAGRKMPPRVVADMAAHGIAADVEGAARLTIEEEHLVGVLAPAASRARATSPLGTGAMRACMDMRLTFCRCSRTSAVRAGSTRHCCRSAWH